MRYEYFAASNSAEGFVNYFPQIFSNQNCSRVYIIKGGPGTGKSRFMREVANEAENRGLTVKYYYCSSDPESLDGIIIDEMRVGMLDGTAPHIFEPMLVGAREQIINLGEFWDGRKLAQKQSEIQSLTAQKSQAYARAYLLLSAYGKILNTEDALLSPCINRIKMTGAIKRWLHKLPSSATPTQTVGLCRAVGMNGKAKLDTYENTAKMLFTVSDSYRAAHLFLDELWIEAVKRGMSVAVSYDPIMRGRVDALCLCDAGITFVVGDVGEHKINVKRFIDEQELKTVKDRFKKLENAARELDKLIEDSFAEVRSCHFALEDIYIGTMNFDAKEKYTENFIKKLFKKS